MQTASIQQMTKRYTVAQARKTVAASDDPGYGILATHGSMELGFYQPEGHDPQQPHTQDEIYVVQSGSGFFVMDGKREPFEAGEALFVPAGVTHRFEEFSRDFAAWVIFYGPDGGE